MGEVTHEDVVYDRWRRNLPDSKTIDGFVKDAMREFLQKEFEWKDFVTKEDTSSWMLLTGQESQTKPLVHAFLDSGNGKELMRDLQFDNLKDLLNEAGFDAPSFSEFLADEWGYNESHLCFEAGERIPALLLKGDLTLDHMDYQGEFKWTLLFAGYTPEGPPGGEYLTYTMIDTTLKDPKTYHLGVLHDVRYFAGGERDESMQLTLSDDTGKWGESWNVEQIGITDQVFIDAEAVIRGDVLEPDEWEAEL